MRVKNVVARITGPRYARPQTMTNPDDQIAVLRAALYLSGSGERLTLGGIARELQWPVSRVSAAVDAMAESGMFAEELPS